MQICRLTLMNLVSNTFIRTHTARSATRCRHNRNKGERTQLKMY
jgi:hypothetical protein